MKPICGVSAVLLLVALSAVNCSPSPELLNVLDSMGLRTLVKTAKEYPQHHQLILEKYIIEKFHLDESKIDIDLTRRVPNMLLETDYIADDLAETLSVLELFGTVFTRLDIQIDLPGCKENTVQQIAAAVTKYCSKASQKIHLSVRYAYYNIRFQFPQANEVEFVYDYADFDSPEIEDPIDLNQIFPNMQKLRALTVRDSLLNQHFPRLTHFELVKQHDENDNDNLRIFFRENPQLRSVRAPMLCNFQYLIEVNKMLPELESFGIEYNEKFYAPANGVVHFKNVKKFLLDLGKLRGDIETDFASSLSSLKFDQLDSFKLVSREKSKDFLLGLITQHKQLTDLAFQSFDLNNAELVELVKQLPNLKALQVSCTDDDTIDEICKFISQNNSLSTLNISDNARGYKTFKALVDSLQNWQYLGEEIVLSSPSLWKLGRSQ